MGARQAYQAIARVGLCTEVQSAGTTARRVTKTYGSPTNSCRRFSLLCSLSLRRNSNATPMPPLAPTHASSFRSPTRRLGKRPPPAPPPPPPSPPVATFLATASASTMDGPRRTTVLERLGFYGDAWAALRLRAVPGRRAVRRVRGPPAPPSPPLSPPTARQASGSSNLRLRVRPRICMVGRAQA